MTDQQHKTANTIAASLMQQGGDPVYISQACALAVGKIAAYANLEPDQYQTFVRELAEAVINEAGLSRNKPNIN